MSPSIRVAAFLCASACLGQPALACVKADTRWAASSNTLYIEKPVTCTPTQLAAFLNTSVLQLVNPATRTWLLKANLRITGGGTLRLYGSAIGGDTDEFRLLSNNNPANHIRINPRWGTLDIRSTHVTSWDSAAGGPDTDSANGRSYIHAESFLESDGVTARESRMDVIDSEVDHLGFHDAVSYGLVWKVIGDPATVPDIYDRVGVYGSVVRSNVHHNNMGFYSFGAEAIEITDSIFAYNEMYGIDPHDDSDLMVISRNIAHDNGTHGIICSRRCNDLIITDNTVYNNQHGIMLHREVVNTLVANNYVYNNRDNGIAVFESHGNVIRDNIVEYNEKGIRLSLGSHHNLIENNVVRGNSEVGLYLYKGEDPPETTDGRPKDNLFSGNTVVDNGRLIKARDSDRITFTGNTFVAGVADIEIYDSTAIDIVGNTDNLGILDITNIGRVSGFSSVRLEADRDVKTKVDAFSIIEITNPMGRVFDPDKHTGASVISPQGSLLTIDYGTTGASSKVSALPLYAAATSGSFTVDSPTCRALAAAWNVTAATSGQVATFRVACLAPATTFTIRRDAVPIASLTSSATGTLEFTDTFAAASHAYRVAP